MQVNPIQDDLLLFYRSESILIKNNQKLLIIGFLLLWFTCLATKGYLFLVSSIIFTFYTPFYFTRKNKYLASINEDLGNRNTLKTKIRLSQKKQLGLSIHKQYYLCSSQDCYATTEKTFHQLFLNCELEIEYYARSKFATKITVL